MPHEIAGILYTVMNLKWLTPIKYWWYPHCEFHNHFSSATFSWKSHNNVTYHIKCTRSGFLFLTPVIIVHALHHYWPFFAYITHQNQTKKNYVEKLFRCENEWHFRHTKNLRCENFVNYFYACMIYEYLSISYFHFWSKVSARGVNQTKIFIWISTQILFYVLSDPVWAFAKLFLFKIVWNAPKTNFKTEVKKNIWLTPLVLAFSTFLYREINYSWISYKILQN